MSQQFLSTVTSGSTVEFDLFRDDLIENYVMEDSIIEGSSFSDRVNILKDYLSALQELKHQVQVYTLSSSQESQPVSSVVSDHHHMEDTSPPSTVQPIATLSQIKPKQYVTFSKLILPKEYQLNKINSFSDLMIKARVRIPLHIIVSKYQNQIEITKTNWIITTQNSLFSDIFIGYESNHPLTIHQTNIVEHVENDHMDCLEDINITEMKDVLPHSQLTNNEENEIVEEMMETNTPNVMNMTTTTELIESNSTVPMKEKEEVFVDINCDCGICLLPLYDNTQIYNLEFCQHAFHLQCVHRCMESRSIQKCCVKCFTEIPQDERKLIKQLFKEDVRTKRIEKRNSNIPQHSSPPPVEQSKKKKVHDQTFEAPSTPHKINHGLIIEEYGYMLNDHSDLPLNYKCKYYLPALKRSDKPIELICTITLNPDFGKDELVYMLRIESSSLQNPLQSFSFEQLTIMLREAIQEQTSKKIENAKEYFGLKNKKVTAVIDKMRDCEFYYRTSDEIKENSILPPQPSLEPSPLMIQKLPEPIQVSESNPLKRKEPPKEPKIMGSVVKKRKYNVGPIPILRNMFTDACFLFHVEDFTVIDLVINHLENNYGVQATRNSLTSLCEYDFREHDCDIVSKVYILLQHSDLSFNRGIHSLYDLFKECDVKFRSILDLYQALSHSLNIIPNDISYQYAKNINEPNVITISLIDIASKLMLPNYSENEVIEACSNIVDSSNTFFNGVDFSVTIHSKCEQEILYGLYNVVKSMDHFVVDNMDCQTVLLNLITIIDHIERIGIDEIKEYLSVCMESQVGVEDVEMKEQIENEIHNSNELILENMSDDDEHIQPKIPENPMEDDLEPESNQVPPFSKHSPMLSHSSHHESSNSLPSFNLSKPPQPMTQTSCSTHLSPQLLLCNKLEVVSESNSIAECSIEEKELVKNISQQLSQLSSIQLSQLSDQCKYPTKLMIIPQSQESLPMLEFSQPEEKSIHNQEPEEEHFSQLSLSLSGLSSFESEQVPSIFPYFN